MDSPQDIRAEVLSVFESREDSAEPLTTTAVADALEFQKESVADHLADLSERGDLEHKHVGGSRVWWPSRPSDGRTADRGLELEQRRRLDLFENIQDIANVGTWEYDIRADEGWGTDEVLRIHGLEPGSHISPEESIEFYHPDDRPTVREAFERAVECQEPYDLEVRLVDADGNRRWVRTRGQAQFEDSEAVRVHGTIQDITERKDREQELRRNKAFLGNIQEIANIGGWEVDLASETLQWTEEVYRIHGVERDYEPTVEDGIEFYHPDDRETIREAFEHLLSNEEPFDLELRIVRPDGEVRWVRTIGDTWVDESDEMVGTRGVFQDITERKTREQKLEEEQQFTQQALDALDDIFYVLDTDGALRRWNEQVSEALGYTASDLADANVVEFFPEDEHETVLDGIETILSDGDATIEADLLTAGGERIPYEFNGTRLTDTDGNTTGIVGIGRDMTERLQRERRFRALVEESSDIISVVDTEGAYQYQSPSVERILGYGPEEKVGDPVIEYIHPDDREAVRDRFEKWQTTSVATGTIEYRIRHADGSWRWMEARGNREPDNPAVEGYVINSRDITERKERERALEESRNHYRTLVENFPNGVVSLLDENLQYRIVGGTPIEEVESKRSELPGRSLEDVLPADIREQVLPQYRAALDGDSYQSEMTIGDRTHRVNIVPVRNDDGDVFAVMGVSQDITDRKQRVQALEKRKRILHELHTATREFYPARAVTEAAKFLVEFVENAFEFEYVSVKRFDEEAGVLQPAARSSTVDGTDVLGPVSPGSGPVWDAYRHGEARIVDGATLTDGDNTLDAPINQGLVVPIGDFGVTLALTTGDSEFDDVDTDLIEVVTANVESTFQRLRSDRVRTELVEQLSIQQTEADELRSVIDAIQAIQRRLASSESQDALETGVCEELLETDRVDFAWVGRPQGADTDLRPSVWAGDGNGYLDSVGTGDSSEPLPAQRAADDRDPYRHHNIASLVVDEAWAKEALSAEFHSVVSVPLVYDDVLYGVLTAYSQEEDAFGQMYEQLFTDVASLLVNYSRLLEHRYGDAQREYTELEFELADSTYPLQRLAADTASRIRFDTVAENAADEIRVLVTVLDGDAEQVLDAVSSVTSIVDGAWLGDHEQRQLTLTVQKPFLASVVGKHGGELVHSVSDESETRFRVELPKNASKRPLLDSLSSRYREIEPVAQRQTDTAQTPGVQQVADILTDRQYEILNAAYHGGYYETPRQVTGEDLAKSFDISNPAIYNHLQSAHRTLLETVMRASPGINDESDGLNT